MAECINRDSELPKQDCTSPSPTETVCLDSICTDNIPVVVCDICSDHSHVGSVNLADYWCILLMHCDNFMWLCHTCKQDIRRSLKACKLLCENIAQPFYQLKPRSDLENASTSQNNIEKLEFFKYNIPGEEKVEKTNFLNELGLVEECDDDASTNKDDNWEDCIDQDFPEELEPDNELTENFDEVSSCEEVTEVPSASQQATPKSSRSQKISSDSVERNLRKRKLDLNNGFPSKKMPAMSTTPNNNQSATTPPPVQSLSANTTPSSRTRAVIPTKDNPPPEMSEWLAQFSTWSNAERIMAINELIERCEPTQVRHMMQVIEPQFQRDFISLLPKRISFKCFIFPRTKGLT
ncbi:hypothetical protein NQ314_010574 [Rhamnusium bicolor]|uniref:Uncharacterized protein n=1 Tax=Rhamnusium bicolor TaxID=1586634 RepID=A0AAV8XQT7_9CUCU|nr:hypothetical protein NQ314_010574 [Rhamnusium bicolor]